MNPYSGHASAGQLVRTDLHQLYTNTGWSLEELPGVIDVGMDEKRESGKSMLPVWFDDADKSYIYIYIYIYIYMVENNG